MSLAAGGEDVVVQDMRGRSESGWFVLVCKRCTALGLLVFLSGYYLLPDYKLHSQLYYLLVALPFVLVGWRDLMYYLQHSRLFQLALLFLFYMACTAFWTDGTPVKATYKGLVYMLYIVSLFWALCFCREYWQGAQLQRVAILLPALACISFLYSLVDIYSVQNFTIDTRLSNSWSIENLNYYSHALGWLAVASLCHAYLSPNPRLRSGHYLLMTAFLIGVLLTQTKSTLIGLAATAVGLVLVHSRFSRAYKLTFITTLMVAVALVFYFRVYSYDQFVDKIMISTSERMQIYSLSFVKVASTENWLFGKGLFANVDIWDNYGYLHSMYLTTFYNGGLLGFALLCALILKAFQISRDYWHDPEVKLAGSLFLYGATTLVFDGFSLLDHVNTNWLLIWVPYAMLIAKEYSLIERDL